MWGNFNPTQNLKDGDKTVDTRGWLVWEPGDASADLTITVSQDGYDCTGPVTCSPPPTNGTWKVDVKRPDGSKWAKSAATGTASAVVKRDDGSIYSVAWNSPPLSLS